LIIENEENKSSYMNEVFEQKNYVHGHKLAHERNLSHVPAELGVLMPSFNDFMDNSNMVYKYVNIIHVDLLLDYYQIIKFSHVLTIYNHL
jgi:hypothetical protein